MKSLFAALAFLFCFTTPVLAETMAWYSIDPASSRCVQPPLTPRQFEAAMRSQSRAIDTKPVRADDNTLLGVQANYRMDGSDRVIYFWTSRKICQGVLDVLIKDGEMTPPDVQ